MYFSISVALQLIEHMPSVTLVLDHSLLMAKCKKKKQNTRTPPAFLNGMHKKNKFPINEDLEYHNSHCFGDKTCIQVQLKKTNY